MKLATFLLLAGLVTLTAAPRATAGQLLYLASTEARNIVAYDVDDATGRLSEKFRVSLPGKAGPFAFSPDKSFVYAAMTGLKGKRAGVATLRRSSDGNLKMLRVGLITSRAPYIRADLTGRFLLAAHYGAGEVTMYAIENGIMTGKLLDQKKTRKTAHCIEVDPSGRYVFVPHTSPNRVYQFTLDKKAGKLVPNDPPFVAGPEKGHKYHAPRHYAHHPKLDIAYTSNEAGGGITAWKFDAGKGTLSKLQTLSTLPPDYDGSSAAADIQITPNGRFAYVSNRDVTKRKAGEAMKDTLCGVSLDPDTGKMKIVGYYPTAHFPRSFCIDVHGRYLYAAGQLSATMLAYRINQDGSLKRLAEYKTGGTPIWVLCGSVE